MTDWREVTWPSREVGPALAALARASGLAEAVVAGEPPTVDRFDDALVEVARSMGLSAQPVEARYDEIERLIGYGAPSALRVELDGEPRLLMICHTGRREIRIVRPDRAVVAVARAEVCQLIRTPLESALPGTLVNVLAYAANDHARARTRRLVMSRAFGDDPRANARGCWLIRLPDSASLRDQLSRARIITLSLAFSIVALLSYLLGALGWRIIGASALHGRFDLGWIAAWALVFATWIVVAAGALAILGRLILAFRILLRRRLLEGSFKLRPEEVRHEGIGQLLGRIIDTEEFQQLGLNAAVPAMISMIAALLVLGFGASSGLMVALLLGWLGALAMLGWALYRANLRWTRERLILTNHLVEAMAGHRTRLAQLPRQQWHTREEELLQAYLTSYEQLDRWAALIRGVASRGWIVIALLGLMPGMVDGAYSSTEIAISLGGVILAAQALALVTTSTEHFANIAVAWKTSGHLVRAAERPDLEPTFPVALPVREDAVGERPVVIRASRLSFSHRPGVPVLRDCSFEIRAGDRVLVEGASGGGKSTLARLVSGLHTQDAGLLLADGYDKGTIGAAGWRRRVALAPQFHENHVFHGQLAFNLLLGRAWPPQPEDLRQAEQVCHELGLGPLLAKMPARLKQTVGDTGWQLSHGERSRLYIARAILQRAEVLVFDESFAALDPETLAVCLECVARRAPTLVVVAHP